MLICLLFVVVAFIQSALVVQLHQCNEEHLIQQKIARKWIRAANLNGQRTGMAEKPRFNIHQIDVTACAFCALSFILCNIVYWLIFLFWDFN